MTLAIESAEITHVTSKMLFLGLTQAEKGFYRPCLSPEIHYIRLACIIKKSSLLSHILKLCLLPTFHTNSSEKCFPSYKNERADIVFTVYTEKNKININCVTMHFSNNGTLHWGPSE